MDLSFEQVSRVMATVVSPRPLAWITSRGPNSSIVNIAPFNSYMALANNPPVIGVSFSARGGEPKDTLANIEATGMFVLNVVTVGLAEKMNESARESDWLRDDFERLELTPVDIDGVDVPRIGESPAALACRLESILPLPPSRCRLVLARVVGAFVEDGFDAEASQVLASIGPLRYGSLAASFSMPKTWT